MISPAQLRAQHLKHIYEDPIIKCSSLALLGKNNSRSHPLNVTLSLVATWKCWFSLSFPCFNRFILWLSIGGAFGSGVGHFACKCLSCLVLFQCMLGGSVVWRFGRGISCIGLLRAQTHFSHAEGCYSEFGPQWTKIACSLFNFKQDHAPSHVQRNDWFCMQNNQCWNHMGPTPDENVPLNLRTTTTFHVSGIIDC